MNEELERLKKRLDNYYKAEDAILTGQEYSIGSRSLKRADLSQVRNAIKELKKEIKQIENGGKNKVMRGLPLDI